MPPQTEARENPEVPFSASGAVQRLSSRMLDRDVISEGTPRGEVELPVALVEPSLREQAHIQPHPREKLKPVQ
jgi:hypothetical protein